MSMSKKGVEKDIYSLQNKIESEMYMLILLLCRYICLFSIANDSDTDNKESFLRFLSDIQVRIKEIMCSFDPQIEDLKKLYISVYDKKREYELSQYNKYILI